MFSDMSTKTASRLLVIVASTRPGRVGRTVAEWFCAQAPDELGFDVDVADLAEVDLPFLDEPHHPSEHRYVHGHTRRWSARVDEADAFVVVTPEYNAGYPAALKNALDYLYDEWRDKPVGFVSYGMTSGGMRAVEALKPVLLALDMVPLHGAVTVHLRRRLDPAGRLQPDAVMTEAAARMLTRLRVLADALGAMRDGLRIEVGA